MLVDSAEVLIDLVGKDVLLFVHGKEPPSDASWAVLRSFMMENQRDLSKFKGLVLSDGGGPTAEQRRDIKVVVGESTQMKTAIVSSAVLLRFVAASLGLFNSNVRVFEPLDSDKAFDFLTNNPAEQALLTKRVQQIGQTCPKGRFRTLEQVLARPS